MDILREPAETDAMKRLRDEAGKLGEASNQLHGDRNLGYFKLDAPLRNLSRATFENRCGLTQGGALEGGDSSPLAAGELSLSN